MSYVATVKTVRTGVARVAVDTVQILKIRYVGSQVAAHVTLAATTGDMTFEQGATTAAAAVTTGDNPGTSGVINISDLTYLSELHAMINASTDWEAWYVDAPPDLAIEVSAGNCAFITTLTDQDCTVAAGYAVLLDTSLLTAEEHYAGITFNGPSNTPHPHDANTEHLLLEIRALATYAADTVYLSVLACDDVLGTAVVIWGPIQSAATTVEKVVNLNGVPITGTDGLRLVVKMYNDTSAFHATEPLQLVLARESIVKGPALRASHMYARLSI